MLVVVYRSSSVCVWGGGGGGRVCGVDAVLIVSGERHQGHSLCSQATAALGRHVYLLLSSPTSTSKGQGVAVVCTASRQTEVLPIRSFRLASFRSLAQSASAPPPLVRTAFQTTLLGRALHSGTLHCNPHVPDVSRKRMGRPFKQYLNGPRVYSCATCRAHAADHDEIISKVEFGVHGT